MKSDVLEDIVDMEGVGVVLQVDDLAVVVELESHD
jgi:hypothetical protein